MMTREQVRDLLAEQVRDSTRPWSLGTFGGHRRVFAGSRRAGQAEASATGIAAVTERGAVAIDAHERLRPFASESITRQSWSHRVALCLPVELSAMNRRDVLTELGVDREALREQDRTGVLFDIGLDALQADLCVRTSDPEAIAKLRSHAGRSVFRARQSGDDVILAAKSAPGVHQPDRSDRGLSADSAGDRQESRRAAYPRAAQAAPHKRSHPATEPVPDAGCRARHFYPRHPARDAMGEFRPFDHELHQAFSVVDGNAWAARKRHAQDAGSRAPSRRASRHSRPKRYPTAPIAPASRIALRQIKASGSHRDRCRRGWKAFDRLDHDISDEGDGTEPHGH